MRGRVLERGKGLGRIRKLPYIRASPNPRYIYPSRLTQTDSRSLTARARIVRDIHHPVMSYHPYPFFSYVAPALDQLLALSHEYDIGLKGQTF